MVFNELCYRLAYFLDSFFRYCLLNLSRNPLPIRPEDDMFRPSKQSIIKSSILPNGEEREEELELITEYSWRNFFSTINFAKIMQKLSKGRSHRIWMLVQYKSSVSISLAYYQIYLDACGCRPY